MKGHQVVEGATPAFNMGLRERRLCISGGNTKSTSPWVGGPTALRLLLPAVGLHSAEPLTSEDEITLAMAQKEYPSIGEAKNGPKPKPVVPLVFFLFEDEPQSQKVQTGLILYMMVLYMMVAQIAPAHCSIFALA